MEAHLLSDTEKGDPVQEPPTSAQNIAFAGRVAASLVTSLFLLTCITWSSMPIALTPSDELIAGSTADSAVAHATTSLVTNHLTVAHDSTDLLLAKKVQTLVDKLFNRVHKASPLHSAYLDDTTLGKPGMTLGKPGQVAAPATYRWNVPGERFSSDYRHRFSFSPLQPRGRRFRSVPNLKVNRLSKRVVFSQGSNSQLTVNAQAVAVKPTVKAPTAPVVDSATAADFDEMEEVAQKIDPDNFKPSRGPDGRLAPVLTLPGDTLETKPHMYALTAASAATTLGIISWAFFMSSNPLWPLFSLAMGVLAGELFSGTFHWATDNYGSIKTPVVGFACAAFQGHHLAPWTIAHRSFINNVYKIATATIPFNLVGFLFFYLLNMPSGAAFWATMLYCQPFAQEFHRWTHIPPNMLPAWKQKLQKAGVALSFAEHLSHHKPPFDKHYCILNGRLNALLDSKPVLFWRRLEALVYHMNGQEPHSWKDPKVKQLALSTWPGKDRLKVLKNVAER